MPIDPDLQEFTTAANAIATYDQFDFGEELGIKNFYLAQTVDSAGTGYYLTTNATTYSGNITERSTANGGAAYVKVSDLDYDYEFNTPKIIKGEVRFNATIGVYNLNSDASVKIKLLLNLYHVSAAAAETLLATVTTDSVEITNAALDWESKTQDVALTVARTHFAEGETLRLSVEHWSYLNGTPNKATAYGVDPQDRNDDTSTGQIAIKDEDTTQAILAVPFVIE